MILHSALKIIICAHAASLILRFQIYKTKLTKCNSCNFIAETEEFHVCVDYNLKLIANFYLLSSSASFYSFKRIQNNSDIQSFYFKQMKMLFFSHTEDSHITSRV